MDELPEALGNLRQAAHQLLRTPDPTGHALANAAHILDIENLLEEFGEPAFVPGSHSAAGSLRTAGRLLGRHAHMVPSEVWPALHRLLAQVGDHGQH